MNNGWKSKKNALHCTANSLCGHLWNVAQPSQHFPRLVFPAPSCWPTLMNGSFRFFVPSSLGIVPQPKPNMKNKLVWICKPKLLQKRFILKHVGWGPSLMQQWKNKLKDLHDFFQRMVKFPQFLSRVFCQSTDGIFKTYIWVPLKIILGIFFSERWTILIAEFCHSIPD